MSSDHPDKVVKGIREKFDRLMAERDMHDAWRNGPIDASDGLELEGHTQLFLLIPRISFIDSSTTFDEYSSANAFSCSFITMLQFTMFVLQMCAAQLDAASTPPNSYTIHTYLVPLPDENGKTVDYLLVVDITEVSKDVLDISKMFLDVAKSPKKQIDMQGRLMDGDITRGRRGPIPAGVPPEAVDNSSKAKDKYGMFREVIPNIFKYDKVMSIIAQKQPSQTSTQMDPVNNLTLEAALRWARDPRIHPTNKINPKYCEPETWGMVRGQPSKLKLPGELLKFELSPDYWSPSLFCKQFMPHCIPENYNTTFHQNMHVLFKETMNKLKKKTAAPAASSSQPVAPPGMMTSDMILYEAPPIAEMPQLRDEYAGATRDSMNSRYTPSLADGIDAAGTFGMDGADDNNNPANPELLRIKLKLQRNRELIRDVHRAGYLTDDGMLAWQNDATRNAIAEYCRVRKNVSTTATALYKYLEDNHLMDETPEVNIIDTTKPIYDNFMAWFIEILGVFCGVAVHQLTIWDLYVLIGTAFDAPGQQMHACVMGDGGSGKSFSMNALFTLLGHIGIITNDTNSRGADYINERIYDAVIFQDEMDPTALAEKNGNSQIAEHKALLSNGFIQRSALKFTAEGERQIDQLVRVKACVHAGLMNKDQTSVVNANPAEKTSMAALMSRYTPFDMSSYYHFQRTVQFAKAGMNNPQIEKSIKAVINKMVVIQRWRMEVGHLMYIGALPPVHMNTLTMALTKFEKVLGDVNIKATTNRQSVNVERFCRQTVILRCLVERFCVKGVSPFFGKPYRTENLIGTPFVATLDDVTHACTSLYHTYVPRTLTSVISLIRDQVKQATDSENATSLIFSNPTSAPTKHTRSKKKNNQQQGGYGGQGGGAPPPAVDSVVVDVGQVAGDAGQVVGGAAQPAVQPVNVPQTSMPPPPRPPKGRMRNSLQQGQAQITSMLPPAPAAPTVQAPPAPPAGNRPNNDSDDDDDDEDVDKIYHMQYVGFKDISIDKLAQKLHTSAKVLPEIPSVLSIRHCLSILQELLISTPMYSWKKGMDIPVVDSTNNKVFNMQAIEQCGRHTFINLKIIDDKESRFEDLWKRAVLSMCDSKTATRAVLTGIPHKTHVWIPEEIILGPQSNMPSVVLNPNYLSTHSRLIVTGSVHGSLDMSHLLPAASRMPPADETMDGEATTTSSPLSPAVPPQGSLIDESSRAFIDYDMDVDFSNHLAWFVKNGHGAIDSVQAVQFAKDNQSATKIAINLGVIKAQESAGQLGAGREFISFPKDVTDALDKLKEMNTTLVEGVATDNQVNIENNRDIIISVSDIMRGKLSEEKKVAFNVAIARVERENSDIQDTESGIGENGIDASYYAKMHDMQVQDGETLMDLVGRHFEVKQKVLHPTMGLKRLAPADREADEENTQRRPPPRDAPPASQPASDGQPVAPEGISIGNPGVAPQVVRVCRVTDPDEEEEVSKRPRKKKKTARNINITEMTDAEDDNE